MSALANKVHRDHGGFHQRMREFPDDSGFFLSPIVEGEISNGLHSSRSRVSPEEEEEMKAYLRGFTPRDLTGAVGDDYGKIRAHLFEKYGPRRTRNKKVRIEELFDLSSEKELGIQENDLWLASQATTHCFGLITADKGFKRLAQAAGAVGLHLDLHLW